LITLAQKRLTQACIIFIVHYQPCSINWSQTRAGFSNMIHWLTRVTGNTQYK